MLQCACPPNANYNTTNSRLPPFPEPCSIQPEARLRPRLPSSATSNVHAGYAAAALSAATGAALEVASAVAPQTPQLVSGRYLSAATGLRMAVCFHTPLCFLPSHQSCDSAHHRPTREGPTARCTESLYVMTWDMYLVQFDLSVSAADPNLSSDKIYQDSPIKLKCLPMGQWHLRADSFLPPFSSNHPLLACRRQDSAKSSATAAATTASTVDTTATTTISHVEADESTWDSRADSLSLSEPMEIAELRSKADSVSQSLPEGHSFTAAPEGWPKDAAASYWYSQVELTTHHRPLRRIWMGPQFTFRIYPFSGECPRPTDSLLYDSLCLEQSSPPDCSESSQTAHLTTSSCTCKEEYCEHSRPAPRSRLVDPSTFEMTSVDPVGKMQHQSAEGLDFSHRRIQDQPGSADQVIIEGGSYQNSSLGSSLCSLGARSADDVAQNLAEAMQDDDFRAARRSIVYHPGPCPVMFPPSFFPRPHSPNILPSSQSPVLPYSSGPGVRLSCNTLLTPSSARDSLFVLESDFPSQSCTEDTVISPLSFSILPPDSQSGDSQEARAPVDLPIEKLVLEKDEPELVSGDESEGDKAASFAPATPPMVTVDPFEEAKDEQVVSEETETTAYPTSSCIQIDCPKLHAMESASLPRSMGLLQDSEGSLSSSPTKLAYPVTEPGEFSTTESSGGQKKAESQTKPKSAKARKRAAKLQKTKQLAQQSKQSSVNPEAASHATDQQLQHTRKHRNKRTVTPELPQSTALSSDLPSSGEEKAQPTSETLDVPSGASPPTD